MSDFIADPWPQPPVAGNDLDTMLGSLDRQRATFAWKSGGLDAAGLSARLEPSAVTLGGLLKHLARVEDDYFSQRLFERAPHPPFDEHDWDWDWTSAAEDSPEQLYELWRTAVQRSRANVADALADGGLDRLADQRWPDGRAPSLRRMLADMLEEYGRHVGHADLIRESIDGVVGEDPPA